MRIMVPGVKIAKAADLRDVHIDGPLSNISTAYMQSQDDFVAGKVFPVVAVEKQSDKYFTWPKDVFYRNRAGKWVPGTLMKQSGFDLSTDDYMAEFRAFEHPLRWDLRDNADAALQFERAPVEYVTRMILLNREVEWAADFMVTGVWGTDKTGGTDFTQWSDYDNSDPIKDFRDGRLLVKKNTGYTPNTCVLAQEVFEVLADHPLLKELYKYTGTAILTPELVARALRVERLFIAGGIKITSDEGGTNTFDWIFAKRAWLGYVAPRPGLMIPSAGYIFSWRGFTQGFEVGIERIPDRRVKADYTQGFSAYALKKVAADLGYLFDTAVA